MKRPNKILERMQNKDKKNSKFIGLPGEKKVLLFNAEKIEPVPADFSLIERPIDPREVPQNIIQIFTVWMSHHADGARGIIIRLSRNTDYINIVKSLLEEFTPETSSEYLIEDLDKIGDNSLLRTYVYEKLGDLPGKIIFENLGISAKLKAKIIAFSEKTVELIRELKVIVKEEHSEYKDKIKHQSNTMLRMLLLVFIPAAAKAATTALIKATL